MLFVCENNFYMEYTPIGAVTAVEHPAAERAQAYDIPAEIIDGNDVVRRARGRWRGRSSAPGPATGRRVIEAQTYRHYGHSRADPAKYRPAEEVERWMKRDPLDVARARLEALGVDTGSTSRRSTSGPRHTSSAAIEEAKAAPDADPTEAFTDVWADGSAAWRTRDDHLPRRGRRGHRPRDAPRPDRGVPGRGHRRGRRRLQDDGRAVQGVRRRAGSGTPRSPSRRSSAPPWAPR